MFQVTSWCWAYKTHKVLSKIIFISPCWNFGARSSNKVLYIYLEIAMFYCFHKVFHHFLNVCSVCDCLTKRKKKNELHIFGTWYLQNCLSPHRSLAYLFVYRCVKWTNIFCQTLSCRQDNQTAGENSLENTLQDCCFMSLFFCDLNLLSFYANEITLI